MTIIALAMPAGIIQATALPSWNQWRGNWNQTTTYLVNDVCFDGFSSYIATGINTNKQPSQNGAFWNLVALGTDPSVLNSSAAAAASSASQAAGSAASSANSATLAAAQIGGAANAAGQSANSATQSAASAVQSQTAAGAAHTSETNAAASATAAAGSATASANSATASAGSATGSASSATLSQAWASQMSGTVDGTLYSARYYAAQAQAAAQANAAGSLQINANLSDLQSPKTARVNLGIDKFTGIGDAAYTILATDRVVATTAALTAPRTWTLPAANTVNPGQRLAIVDQAGGISVANMLTIAAAGTDTLNGAASAAFAAAYSELSIVSDGVSRWTFDVQGVARGGTGATTAAGALANLGAAPKGLSLCAALLF